MDSLMLGSLTLYRRMLRETLFNPNRMSASPISLMRRDLPLSDESLHELPTIGHSLAGVMAGWTVLFIAAPVEHIKARLQIQYSSEKSKRLYKGPIDCAKKIYRFHGVPGLYHGLSATLLFRSFFFFWVSQVLSVSISSCLSCDCFGASMPSAMFGLAHLLPRHLKETN